MEKQAGNSQSVSHRTQEKIHSDRHLEKVILATFYPLQKGRQAAFEPLSAGSQVSASVIAPEDIGSSSSHQNLTAVSTISQNCNADSTKVSIRMTDMSEKMQLFAIETAKEAKRKITTGNQDVAKKIKLEFDQHFQSNWHCIVGSDFGSFISYELKNVIFFYIGRDAFLIWKTL